MSQKSTGVGQEIATVKTAEVVSPQATHLNPTYSDLCKKYGVDAKDLEVWKSDQTKKFSAPTKYTWKTQLIPLLKERMTKARRKVKEAYSFQDLKEVCQMSEVDFELYADEYKGYQNQSFWYRDRESNVLAVAHLDSVQSQRVCREEVFKHYGRVVFSPVLDDRLGAYTICELLPKLGIEVDLLLTTDEEMANSTAQEFFTAKQYHWMVEFDRSGDDVVLYDYETDSLRRKLEAYGWSVGSGSYSDIAELEHLKCKGMNIGVSYFDYHSHHAYAIVNEYLENVARFLLWYQDYKDVYLPHEPKPRKYYHGYGLYSESGNLDSHWDLGEDKPTRLLGGDDDEEDITIGVDAEFREFCTRFDLDHKDERSWDDFYQWKVDMGDWEGLK